MLAACIATSLSFHILGSILIQRFGMYEFGKPITAVSTVIVEVSGQEHTVIKSNKSNSVRSSIANSLLKISEPAAQATEQVQQLPPEPQQQAGLATQPSSHTPVHEPSGNLLQLQPIDAEPSAETRYVDGNEIVPVQQEKLVYQLSIGAMPVGSAQLEATNTYGELRIRSEVRTNNVVSAFYPVHNSTDTRLIKGKYLMTRIRQHEGNAVSDTGFTIMYPDRKIFWVDRIKKRSSNEPLETTDTLDFVTGFYFLRQQQLAIGKTRELRLYDGDTTTLVQVSVLRNETITLPGMRSTEALVLQPHFAVSGFFRNNRNLMIWLTNDDNRIPVRIEATTPIGRVTAELVSSHYVIDEPS